MTKSYGEAREICIAKGYDPDSAYFWYAVQQEQQTYAADHGPCKWCGDYAHATKDPRKSRVPQLLGSNVAPLWIPAK